MAYQGKKDLMPSVVLLLILLYCTTTSSLTCHFPSLLQDGHGGPAWWLYRVTYAGAQLKNNTIVYVEMYGGHMSTTSLGSNEINTASYSYERECRDVYQNQTFLVAHFQRGHKVQYMCMQFVIRSKHVVQLAVSRKANESADLNCTNEPFALDPWPLVRFDDKANESYPCPVQGGYDVKLLDRHSQDLCTDKYFIARYECGCEDSQFIHLDLQACHIGSTLVGMESQQKVINIASWEDGEHIFTILKRPRVGLYWSLRLPRQRSQSMVGYLSSDVICSDKPEMTNIDNALTLHLTERIVDSICADVSPYCSPDKCKEASLFTEIYCEATCGHCDNSKKTTCMFPPSAQGSWSSVTDENINFTVTSDSIIVGDEIQPCVSHDALTKTYQMVRFDQRGCYPQYVCMTLKPAATSVIRYKFFPGPAWDPLFKPTMCYANRKYNFVTQEARFSLAAMTENDGVVPCELPAPAYGILAVSQNGSACHGLLYKPDCEGADGTHFVLNYTRCLDETALLSLRLACLAQLPVFAPRRMVLMRDEQSGTLFCLSFATTLSNLELLPASKCRGSFNQDDVITTIHVTRELTTCNITENSNVSFSRFVNYSRPILRASYKYFTTSSPHPTTKIHTVRPYMPRDRNNDLAEDKGVPWNYYSSSARGFEGHDYGNFRGQKQEDRLDCEDKINAETTRCKEYTSRALAEKNRTLRKSGSIREGGRAERTTFKSSESSTQLAAAQHSAAVSVKCLFILYISAITFMCFSKLSLC